MIRHLPEIDFECDSLIYCYIYSGLSKITFTLCTWFIDISFLYIDVMCKLVPCCRIFSFDWSLPHNNHNVWVWFIHMEYVIYNLQFVFHSESRHLSSFLTPWNGCHKLVACVGAGAGAPHPLLPEGPDLGGGPQYLGLWDTVCQTNAGSGLQTLS